MKGAIRYPRRAGYKAAKVVGKALGVDLGEKAALEEKINTSNT